MKRFLILLGLACASAPAFAGDVGVSIRIGEPGFFGRIDIGDAPRPVLVAPRAVVIERPPPHVVVEEPIYLHVPVEESRNWRRYCGRYDACGRPVYFVQDRWYKSVYVPHYRSHHEVYERYYHERHEDRHDWRGERRDDWHDDKHDKHDHGRGHDHDHDDDHDRDHDHH
jgi:hypothetical protein